MDAIGSTALWLAAVAAGWSVVTARAGRGDPRLVASGARALQAAGVLVPVALLAALLASRAEAIAVAGTASVRMLLVAMLADPRGMILVLAGFTAACAACVPRVVRDGAIPDRTRAYAAAGALTGLVVLAAALARGWNASTASDSATSPELFHWSGVAFRVLYLAGLAVAVVPLAVPPTDRYAPARLRSTRLALAAFVAALGLGAWARHSGIAPPADVDASGNLVDPAWSSAHLLLAVPPLLYAASAFTQRAGRERPAAPARIASMLMLVVAALVAAALGPSVLDWVGQRDVEIGAPIGPLGRWGAIAATVAATLLAALAVARAVQDDDRAARLWHAALAAALLALGMAAVAVSARPQQLIMRPGVSATASGWGGTWTLTSQGVSQEEGEHFDGALVAFEVTRNGRTSVESAGERIYRDPHGHAAARVAVPGVVRTAAGDLRLTVRALRGDEALVRAQFHPLAWVGWSLAVLTVLLMAASAAVPDQSRRADP